jgi:hypothetical protein
MSLGMLPTSFVRNVTSAFPDGGQWLANLPGLLAECLRMWDLVLDGEVYALSFNYVVPVMAQGKEPAVLKLSSWGFLLRNLPRRFEPCVLSKCTAWRGCWPAMRVWALCCWSE